MLTPEFDVIISTLSELSGKSIAERDAMVAGGNALIEALKRETTPKTATTLAGLLGTNAATSTYNSFYISESGVVTVADNSSYRVVAILVPFKKGDILHYHREATTNRTMRFGFTTIDPTTLTTIEGLTLDMACNQSATVHDYDIICPYDGAYLLFYYYNNNWVAETIRYDLWCCGAHEIDLLKEKTGTISMVNANIFGGNYDIDGKSVAQYSNTHYVGTDLIVHNNPSCRLWRITNKGYTHARVYTRAYTEMTTLAFYINGAYTAPEECIRTERTGFRWYEADIPVGCTTIAVSYRGPSGNPDEAEVQIILTAECDKGIIDEMDEIRSEVSEIRTVQNIPTDYVPREISVAEKNEIPPYYFSRPAEPTIEHYNSYLEEKIQSVPEGKHFIFVTDTHWRYNAKKSPALINYVRKRLGVPYVIFGGDAMHRPANKDTETPIGSGIWRLYSLQWHTPSESRIRAQTELSEYCTIMKERFGDHFLFVTGNHDLGLANLDMGKPTGCGWQTSDIPIARVPYQDIIREAHTSLKDRAVYDEQGLQDVNVLSTISDDEKEELKAYIKQSYYVDDNINQLRYIITYTGQGGIFDGVASSIFGLSGSDCLCSELKFIGTALMTLPVGYDVVIAGHWFYKRTDSKPFIGTQWLLQMITAYKEGVSFSIRERGDTLPNFSTWMNASSRVRDFSTLAYRGRILLIAGHNHTDHAEVLTQSSADYRDGSLSSYDYGAYPYSEDPATRLTQYLGIAVHRDGGLHNNSNEHINIENPTSTGGSILSDCAFDVVTITTDHKVHCTRIGYGVDREFILPDVAPEDYTPPVTSTLGLCNEEEDIEE